MRIKEHKKHQNTTIRIHMQTEKISSSLRRHPWRRYVLCAVEGCSMLEAQQRRTRSHRVSSQYVAQRVAMLHIRSYDNCTLSELMFYIYSRQR